MAVKLGSLLIELGLDSAKFRSGLRQSEAEMSRSSRAMASGANAVRGAVAGMVGALSIGVFTNAIREAFDYASALGETAQQLGVTTTTLQEYRYAAQQVGIEQNAMDQSLRKLTLAIGQSPEKFAQLGINVRDANGHFRDAGDILPELAEKLHSLDAAQQQATLASLGLGRSAAVLGSLTADGAAGVNRLREEAQRLGLVLSQEQINRLDTAADTISRLQTQLQIRVAGAVADNAGEIENLARVLGVLAAKAIEAFGAINRLYNRMRELGGAGAGLARGLQTILNPVGAAYDTYGEITGGGRAAPTGPRPTGPVNLGTPSRLPAPVTPQPVANRNARPGSILYRSRFINDDQSDQVLNGAPRVTAALRETATAATAVVAPLRAASEEVQTILDRLYPTRAARRGLEADVEQLRLAMTRGELTATQYAEAVALARQQFGAYGEGLTDWGGAARTELQAQGDAIRETITAFNDQRLSDFTDSFERDARRMGRAGEDAVDGLNSALQGVQGLVNGFKSGDVLSIFQNVLGILDAIGGVTGGFNIGPLQFGGSRIPGFATGTGFAPGGLAWVGERGRELVNLPRGATVTPVSDAMGGQMVQIIPSPYFDVVVDGRVQTAAPGIASAGAQGAQLAMARSGRRQLR